MKRIKGLVLLCLLGSLSCSEDFQLTEPYKDLSVVYGFISTINEFHKNEKDVVVYTRLDTAQYIRVEKLFVDENIPASQIAKNVDSLYYKNAKVSLTKLNKNPALNVEYFLTMVDANLEGFQRNEGPFATSPNYMYKIKSSQIPIESGDSLLFKLDRGEKSKLVTARINILNKVEFNSPSVSFQQLNFKPDATQEFAWVGGSDAILFDFIMKIYVEETNAVTLKKEVKTLKWNIKKSDYAKSAIISNKSFYSILSSGLKVDGEISRQIQGIELILVAGGVDLNGFNLIVNANTGLTASQEIPRFTNLSDGFGLLASTTTTIRPIGIHNDTKSYLKTEPLTAKLNFK